MPNFCVYPESVILLICWTSDQPELNCILFVKEANHVDNFAAINPFCFFLHKCIVYVWNVDGNICFDCMV